MEQKTRFDGWKMAVLCFCNVFIATGIGFSTKSIYVSSFCDYYQMTRVTYSLIQSAGTILGAVVYVFYGAIVKKVGVKNSLVGGMIVTGTSKLILSYAPPLPVYSFAMVLGATFYVFTSLGSVSQIVYNWFNEKRGLVLGVIYAASGLGGAFGSSILGKVLINTGWQAALKITAACIYGIAIVTWFLLIVSPAEVGQLPYGTKAGSRSAAATGCEVKEGLHDYHFWLIVLGCIMMNFAQNASYQNVSPHLQAEGMDMAFITSVVLVVTMCANAASKPLMGIVNDKFSLRASILIPGISTVIGMYLMAGCGADQPTLAIVSGGMIGFGTAITTVAVSFLLTDLLGLKSYSYFIGIMNAVKYLGTTFGPLYASSVFDKTGSYAFSYTVNSFVMAGAVCVLIASTFNIHDYGQMEKD